MVPGREACSGVLSLLHAATLGVPRQAGRAMIPFDDRTPRWLKLHASEPEPPGPGQILTLGEFCCAHFVVPCTKTRRAGGSAGVPGQPIKFYMK